MTHVRNTSLDLTSDYHNEKYTTSYLVSNMDTLAFHENPYIIEVNLTETPIVNNTMYNAFCNCRNLQTVTNINQNVTNMSSTFWYCTSLVNVPSIPNSVTDMSLAFAYCSNLVNVPTIPNSVTNMYGTFSYCSSLVNAPIIPNSVTNMAITFYYCNSLVNAPVIPDSVTDMRDTFFGCKNLVNAPTIPNSVTDMVQTFARCTNLTDNVYIYSNQITNASLCFGLSTKEKNVYIPFKYENSEYTQTYNSFINAEYSTTTRKDGALLFDINPPRKYIETNGYEFTNANDKVSFTKYIGTSTTVTVPTIQEEE